VSAARGGRLLVAGAVAAGLASLAVPSTLGYDAWAWMVWGRELVHLDLSTTGGPSWKPLPALLVAPLAWIGGVAPVAWLAAMRAAALVALLAAYRVGARLAGPVAGATAAIALALSADLYRTTLLGSTEPLLIALVLGAADRHLAGRRGAALVLVALAALIRPEAWPFLVLYGAYAGYADRAARPLAAAAVTLPIAIWLGLDWAGSGSALHGGHVAAGTAEGSAARTSHPGLEVLRRGLDTVLVPVLVLAAGALVEGARRRERTTLALGAVALAWTAIVAVMAQGGYPGLRRYLVVPGALACVLAGVAMAWLLGALRARAARIVAVGVVAAVAAVPAFHRAREDGRLLSVARAEADQLRELRRAVADAGGRGAVVRAGRPVVNPWVQTALAWELHVRLSHVQATWSSSRRRPHWTPPALVFRAPARLAGPRPAFPATIAPRAVARSGRWRVYRAAA
jgi:hypothetical protein